VRTSTSVDQRGDGEPQRGSAVAGLVDDQDAPAANLLRRGSQHRRRLAHGGIVDATGDQDRTEIPVQDRSDHRARNDSGRRDTDDDFRVVGPRDLQRQRPG
jgi:hypothetical protein